jgi:nucleoside-diphosphate-sugar epimerase
MNVIITGATGMVGKAILLECLDHSSVKGVLSISRRSVGIQHPKLTELLHADFSEFSSVSEKLNGYDACFMSMGVSSAGMSEEKYTLLTHGYTLALARELIKLNKEMTITYVSGKGTDSSEAGKLMWARVKGKTENDLLALGFKQAFMFRPGFIVPKRGVYSSSKLYRILITAFRWLFPIIRLISPKSIVDSDEIGLAMIHAVERGYPKTIIDPVDMQVLGKV